MNVIRFSGQQTASIASRINIYIYLFCTTPVWPEWQTPEASFITAQTCALSRLGGHTHVMCGIYQLAPIYACGQKSARIGKLHYTPCNPSDHIGS